MMMRQVVIMTMVIVKMLFVCGCEDEKGFWISPSCRPYEGLIRHTVTVFNDREPEDAVDILGHRKSTGKPFSTKQMNDDIDFFYCYPDRVTPDIAGRTGKGYGDVHLFGLSSYDDESIECSLMHELGHRVLSLGHSDDPNTIMYEDYVDLENCLYQPWGVD
jgi:hypothetical protein